MKLFQIISLMLLLLLGFSGCEKKQEIKTVSFISLSNVDDNTFSGFKERMKEFGWEEHVNIQYSVAGAAQKVEFLPKKVSDALSKNPDLILVASTPATQEVKKQNSSIPTVFCPVSDPIGANIMKNTNQPQGVITGVRLPVGDQKRTEWLYQIVPNLKSVFVPYTPDYQASAVSRNDMKQIAKELDFNIIEKPLVKIEQINQFLNAIPKDIDAIILPRDSLIESMIEHFVNYSLEHKIPLSVPSYQQVQKGALYTFGFIHKELGKDAAAIADKILRGVHVSDLPVKYGNAYLVLNETTAKKIGITFSLDTISNAKLIIK